MPFPNFIIVGAAKAGTTSLFEYMGQHPDVHTPPVKEPCYFSAGLPAFAHNEAEYKALFSGWTAEKAIGEASSPYLYDPDAATRIHDLLPRTKIVILLRNPTDRAYSEWAFNTFQLGCESLSFEQALDAEDKRVASTSFQKRCRILHCSSFYYFRVGLYDRQVQRYLDAFGSEQVRVYIFEEFIQDPTATCQAVFEYLEINPDFVPTFDVHNAPQKTRSRLLQHFLVLPPSVLMRTYSALPFGLRLWLHKIARRLYEVNLAPQRRPTMDSRLKATLNRRYAPSIQRLETLLGRDLTIWHKNSKSEKKI